LKHELDCHVGYRFVSRSKPNVGRKSGLIAPSAECDNGGKMAEGAGKQPPALPPYDSQSHCERSPAIQQRKP